MSWDPRAERISAKAEAERARAEAERIRVQADIERARVQAELDRQAKQDREVEREKRRAEAAKRCAAVVAVIRRWAVPLGAIGSPEVIAWSGQLGFAKTKMHLGGLAALLPVALEGGTLYTAKLALEAIEAGKPAGRYRFATWVQAGIAAGMNYWHGSASGVQVGVAFALTSLLGIVMLELTVALRWHKAGGRSATQIRIALVRRLRFPVLSVQATAIGAARGLDVEAAWRAAWVDRYGIGPEATRRERRMARAVLARRRRMDRKAARRGELAIVGGTLTERSALTGRPGGSEDVPLTPHAAYARGGVAELEQMLREAAAGGQGATLDAPGGPHERSHRERMSAHHDEPVSDDERPDHSDTERSTKRQSGGKGERPKRRRSRKAIARGDRLAEVRRLLDERPDMSGAQIAATLGIPESTARRLRARVLDERGEQS